MSNPLADATSPFLRAHQDNPVGWRTFSPAAFEEARAADKPVLLTIGYNGCHWCHVMNAESFSDPETAALIGEHFVPVIVDREERPDIDQLYQAAANTMGYSGGWPLTMFLTPAGEPYFATGYLPREGRFDQPSFRQVLSEIGKAYQEQGQSVVASTGKVKEALTQMWATSRRGPINNAMLDEASIRIAHRYDIFYGGLTGAPKFPAPNLLKMMWHAYLRTSLEQFAQVVGTTLHNVCQGGIYDHLAGGFCRYATDERWQVPHFEKMLYDNAQMVDILTTVVMHNRWPLYLDRIRETVTFMMRDLRAGDAFAAGIGAGSDSEEGKYYVWSEAEIDAALKGTFASRFKEIYNVTKDGNFNGRNVLHRLGAIASYPLSEADETLFARQRNLLAQARAKRNPPPRDEQILADWNGMAITALARAGSVFKQNEWLGAAVNAFDFVCTAMAGGDRLYHSWAGGKRNTLGFASDYAQMIRAAITLFEATQDARFLERARAWTRTLNLHYWDESHGGYFTTADDAPAQFARPRMVFDQITPSANGVMLTALTKLFLLTNETEYRDRLNGVITAFSGEVPRAAISMPTYLTAFETALMSLEIVVFGPLNAQKTKALLEAIRSRSLPEHVVVVVESGAALPLGHAARDKGMQNGEPAAYICQNGTLSIPFTNPQLLAQQLILPPMLAARLRAEAEAAARNTGPRQGAPN